MCIFTSKKLESENVNIISLTAVIELICIFDQISLSKTVTLIVIYWLSELVFCIYMYNMQYCFKSDYLKRYFSH